METEIKIDDTLPVEVAGKVSLWDLKVGAVFIEQGKSYPCQVHWKRDTGQGPNSEIAFAPMTAPSGVVVISKERAQKVFIRKYDIILHSPVENK